MLHWKATLDWDNLSKDEMNFTMNHAPGAGSIAGSAVQCVTTMPQLSQVMNTCDQNSQYIYSKNVLLDITSGSWTVGPMSAAAVVPFVRCFINTFLSGLSGVEMVVVELVLFAYYRLHGQTTGWYFGLLGD